MTNDDAERYRVEYAAIRRQIHAEVLRNRARIMKAAARTVKAGSHGEDWMVATRRLEGDPLTESGVFGDLHVRDPRVLPHISSPTTKGGRYLTGDIRDAGPGSHIGAALCGRPFMADEIWVTATHLLVAASRRRQGYAHMAIDLCGMCSYLSGQPTLDAAIDALAVIQ